MAGRSTGRGQFWGANASRLAAADERLARSADVVVAVNDDAAQRWRTRGVDAIFVPNGCDTTSFRADALPIPDDARLPRPVAGFVGHLNARTDLSLLEAVAANGTSLLLIGPKDPAFEPERLAALVGLPNVRYFGRSRSRHCRRISRRWTWVSCPTGCPSSTAGASR